MLDSQAPSVGWKTPYEYILLIVAILHLLAFLYWEAKVALSPILPFNIWKAPSFLALITVVFFSVMSFGIFSWYFFVWCLKVRKETMLTASASITPLTVGGVIAAFTAAWLIPRLPAQYILATGATAMAISSIILATMPEQQIYWQAMFPAVAIVAFCPDFIFTASQIVASNSVAKTQQGVAGSLIGTLLTYGISTGVGFGGTVEIYTNRQGTDLIRGYRGALYLGIAFAVAALVLSLTCVRIKRDVREGWEKEDLVQQDRSVTDLSEPTTAELHTIATDEGMQPLSRS